MALIITFLFHFISIYSGSCTELYNVGMQEFKLFFHLPSRFMNTFSAELYLKRTVKRLCIK